MIFFFLVPDLLFLLLYHCLSGIYTFCGFQMLHDYLLGQCIPLVIKGFCLYKLAVCSHIVFVLPASASFLSSFIIHLSASLKGACLSPHVFLSPPDLGLG